MSQHGNSYASAASTARARYPRGQSQPNQNTPFQEPTHSSQGDTGSYDDSAVHAQSSLSYCNESQKRAKSPSRKNRTGLRTGLHIQLLHRLNRAPATASNSDSMRHSNRNTQPMVQICIRRGYGPGLRRISWTKSFALAFPRSRTDRSGSSISMLRDRPRTVPRLALVHRDAGISRLGAELQGDENGNAKSGVEGP